MQKTRYKIGITEAGDAGIDLSWKFNTDKVDGLILITKHITPEFITAALTVADKAIVHATITGYGGTVLEPNVPKPYFQKQGVLDLVEAGFPKDKIVIRVDPIIPTPKGVDIAQKQILKFAYLDFKRYRVSCIDMYKHVYNRFQHLGIKSPYDSRFYPDRKQIGRVNKMICYLKNKYALRIEACAEAELREAIRCGCISKYDFELLNLPLYKDISSFSGYQRNDCLCYQGKVELLNNRHPCEHNCLYCYWKKLNETVTN